MGWARCTVPTPFVSLAQYDRGDPGRSLPTDTSVPARAISLQVRGAVRIPTWFQLQSRSIPACAGLM